MIDRAEAVQLAREYVARIDDSFSLLDAETREETFGWVFCYGHPAEQLAGNAPFVVLRDRGTIEETGTACPLDEYLASIRSAWDRRRD